MVGIVALALVVIAVVALSVRALVRRGWSRPGLSPGPRLRLPAGRLRLATAGTVLLVALGITLVILARSNSASTSQADALATNPDLDPGTPVSGVAPDFTLADQFGQPVSLHSFRGKVVHPGVQRLRVHDGLPADDDGDARCQGDAGQGRLAGAAAGGRRQSGGDLARGRAGPTRSCTGCSTRGGFLTGSLPQLQQVWKAYGIEAAIQAGEITHTPALFVIGPHRPARARFT